MFLYLSVFFNLNQSFVIKNVMIKESADFLKGYFNVSSQVFLALFTSEAGHPGHPFH